MHPSDAPAGLSDHPPDPWWGRATVHLAGLVLFALALRLLLIAVSHGIFRDGFRFFILQAELLAAGEWDYALRCPQHPLTALFIVVVQPLAGDWVLAGQLISAVCGSLVLVPVFLLTRDLVSPRAGVVAAAAAAVSPYAIRFSAHVLSDALYWALMLSAVTAGWWALSRQRSTTAGRAGWLVLAAWLALSGPLRSLSWLGAGAGLAAAAALLAAVLATWALQRRSPGCRAWAEAVGALGWFALAGLLTALAYLTRPEGAAVAPVVLLGSLVCLVRGPRRGLAVLGGVVFLGVLLFTASPYAYLLGGPTLKKDVKRNVAGLVSRPTASPSETAPAPAAQADQPAASSPAAAPHAPTARRRHSTTGRLLKSLYEIVCLYSETWHYFLGAIGTLGLLLRRVVQRRRAGEFYLGGIIALNVVSHLLLYATEGYLARRYAVAVGLLAVPWTGAGWCALVSLAGSGTGGTARPNRSRWVNRLLVIILLASTIPKGMKPQEADKAGFREAGRWLAAHSPTNARIMVSQHPHIGARAARVATYAGAYPPLPQAFSRPGDSLHEPPDTPAPGRLWPSRLPELWELPSFPLKHRRRIIFAPGTRRMAKLMHAIDRGRIDYFVADHEEIDRRFGNFNERVLRDAAIAREQGRKPELELIYSCPLVPNEPDSIFIYRVNRPILSYLAPTSEPDDGEDEPVQPTPLRRTNLDHL